MEVKNIPRKKFLQPAGWEILITETRFWILEHKTAFFGLCLVAVALIGGIFGYLNYAQSVEKSRLNKNSVFFEKLIKIEDKEEALASIDQFLKTNPEEIGNLQIFSEKVRLMTEEGKDSEAEELMKAFIADQEKPLIVRTIVNFRLIDLYFHQNKDDEGIELLRSMDGGEMEDLRLYYLGLAYLRKNDLPKAKEMFEAVIEGFPQSILANDVKSINLLI